MIFLLRLPADTRCFARGHSEHDDVRKKSPQVCLHSQPITSLALTADGRHFFTAAGDGAVFMCKIQVWTHRTVFRSLRSRPTTPPV